MPTTRPGYAEELFVGAVIQDPNGGEWVVTRVPDVLDTVYKIRNASGERSLVVQRHHPITFIEPTHDEAQAALEELGAHVVAEWGPDRKVAHCEPFPTQTRAGVMHFAQGHLLIMHGVSTVSVKTLQRAIEIHTAEHDDGITAQGYQDHVHS